MQVLTRSIFMYSIILGGISCRVQDVDINNRTGGQAASVSSDESLSLEGQIENTYFSYRSVSIRKTDPNPPEGGAGEDSSIERIPDAFQLYTQTNPNSILMPSQSEVYKVQVLENGQLRNIDSKQNIPEGVYPYLIDKGENFYVAYPPSKNLTPMSFVGNEQYVISAGNLVIGTDDKLVEVNNFVPNGVSTVLSNANFVDVLLKQNIFINLSIADVVNDDLLSYVDASQGLGLTSTKNNKAPDLPKDIIITGENGNWRQTFDPDRGVYLLHFDRKGGGGEILDRIVVDAKETTFFKNGTAKTSIIASLNGEIAAVELTYTNDPSKNNALSIEESRMYRIDGQIVTDVIREGGVDNNTGMRAKSTRTIEFSRNGIPQKLTFEDGRPTSVAAMFDTNDSMLKKILDSDNFKLEPFALPPGKRPALPSELAPARPSSPLPSTHPRTTSVSADIKKSGSGWSRWMTPTKGRIKIR